MNRNKKIMSGVISGAIAMSMVTPVFAANNNTATIDSDRKGTINIHKIIENDGTLINSNGLARDGIDGAVPVDNIGYDYVQIATIEQVQGILVSDINGDIDLNAGHGEVSVGTYFQSNDKLEELFDAAEIYPNATYIKTAVNPEALSTLQYQWNDNVLNNLLKTEQQNVTNTKNTLNNARTALRNSQNEYSKLVSAEQKAKADASNKAAALAKADAAQKAAQQSFNDANTALNTARTNAQSAAQEASNAATALNEAQTAFDQADAKYQNGDNNTLQLLAEAKEALRTATNEYTKASNAYAEAEEAAKEAEDILANATAAYEAAQTIMDEAQAASDRADTGEVDSEMGTNNALEYAKKQLDNAKTYLDEAQDSYDKLEEAKANANSAKNAANTALEQATSKFNTALSNNTTAYEAYADALAKLNEAKNTASSANKASTNAQTALDEATETYNRANDTLTQANQALADAQSASTQADAASSAATGAAENYKNSTLAGAQASYNTALTDYKNAVSALDQKAAANGIVKVYTGEGLEKAMQKIITTLGEEDINEWVKTNAPTAGERAEGYTDDMGNLSFSGLELGLYMIAETDITYHDGYAGAWNDGASGFINNDQMNTYDADGYHIQPVDGWSNETVHTYKKGELYRESHNPEAPVIESKSAPFLVMVPTTNTVDTTQDDVAAGDNYGETGTVWQYTIDVFPKNQTTAIYKRIVDPDEKDGEETLRTSEDFQIGDVIEQVIWADAPTLQKNYLFDMNDFDFGDGLEGDLDDREDYSDSRNNHLGYVISDTMTKGLTFDGVQKVVVVSKEALNGNNVEKEIYTDGTGAIVSKEDAMDGTSYKTTVKYFDTTGHEISADLFTERTGVAASSVDRFYSDVDNEGVEHGSTSNTYSAKDGLTGEYYVTRISAKKIVIPSGSSVIPSSVDTFDVPKDGTVNETTELVEGEDYIVVNTNDEQVDLTDSEGNVYTAVERITDDHHGFAVVLTEEGLAKLDARTKDSVVIVYFDSIINKDATIGQVPQNMNYPSLHWINTNTSLRTIRGNEVYDYTYELQIQKNGVLDGNNVKFVVRRKDEGIKDGDFMQVTEKDLTDTVSRQTFYNQDDSIRFVKEADGVYHVWGYIPGENEDEGDGASSFETSVVNGVTYNTVTPAKDGKLVIKGIDSNDYEFKEIQTEDENNLLKSTFTISIRANDNSSDDALGSLRDGAIATATVTSGSATADITIGVTGVTEGQDINDVIQKNMGIASMEVNNFDAIDLRTGGHGTTMYYIIGGVLASGIAVGMYVVGKKTSKVDK